jgi:hypothetical protein
MNLLDLSSEQLKRAASIKEKIETLNRELRSILGSSANSRIASTEKRTMSSSVKKKIAAAQKARWANLRGRNSATPSIKPNARVKKKTFSAVTRAKLSAKLKAYWAAKKSGKK